jgi:hypothetical protein
VSWDSIKNYGDFQEFAVLRGQAGLPDHNLKQIGYTHDTVYFDSMTFSSEQTTQYEYCVLIHNKLGDAGKYYGIYSVDVMPYQTTIPKIDTIKAAFDTAHGVINLAWDSIPTFSGFDGYLLVRAITTTFETNSIIDTIGMIKKPSYSDSLYKKTLSFSDSIVRIVSYSICAHRKDWNLYGRTSISKSLTIVPYYTKVPMIDSVAFKYDTLKGTLRVSWDSLKNFAGLEGYLVTRKILNSEAGIDKRDTFMVKNAASFIDTIYPKYVAFSALTGTTVTYGIAVKHKLWGITGGSRVANSMIFSYQYYKPIVSAGPDQNVDISSDVSLQAKVLNSAWPIIKQEWKIGDGDWVTADSGSGTFKTNSDFNTETIVCIFRATDSIGNIGMDTANIVKQQLVVTFGNLPTKSMQATQTVVGIVVNSDKFWLLGDIDYGKYAVWSTKDFNSWTLENSSPGIQNNGQMICCNGSIYSFGLSWGKSYKSQDGVSWNEITPDIPQMNTYTSVCVLGTKIYFVGGNYSITGFTDTLFSSLDGVTWSRFGLSITESPVSLVAFDQKLYFTTGFYYNGGKRLVSSDNGITWADDPMWDKDYATFPDDIYQLFGDDSVMVAYYNERPAGIKKVSMFRNDIWTNVPIGGLGVSSNYYENGYFLFKNRLMCIIQSNYNSYTIRSIKLY